MPWGKVDDNFYDHPKLDRLPAKDRLSSVGLHWLAISWCNRWLTDGHVPTDRVFRLGGTQRLADALVAAELWELADGGYQVHDYLEFNQSKDQVQRGREQRAAAGRAGGMAKRRASEASSDSLGGSLRSRSVTDELPSRPVPTRPDPDSSGRTGTTSLGDARDLSGAAGARGRTA